MNSMDDKQPTRVQFLGNIAEKPARLVADLQSILTVPYQLSRGFDPSRLPRAPNLFHTN